MSDRVLISPPVIREEIARWLPEGAPCDCDPSYAWSAPRLAKMLDEVREALGAPIDGTHAEVLGRIDLLRAGMGPNPAPVLVAEFLAWCDTTGEHHGQPWAAMVDTLRETQP